MSLSVEVEVSAIFEDGFADIIRVSSDASRETAVVISINEEMARVDGDDLISAIRRAMTDGCTP